MRLRTMAAATAAASALAMGVAGTSTAATTHHAPAAPAHVRVHQGGATFTAPDPVLRTALKGVHTDSTASCGVINIGAPGNYGYAGMYAGQVEQEYDTCTGKVYAHWEWSTAFQNSQYAGASIQLAMGSPYGYTDWFWNIGTTANKDVWVGGENHGDPNPDAWRAGAEINNDGCDAWGTLHWYGGADWDGPQGGCHGHFQGAPAIGVG